MPVRFLAYLCVKPGYKRARDPTVSSSTEKLNQRKKQQPTTNRNLQKNMHRSAFFLCGLLLIFNLQQCSTYPIRTGLTETDIDVLKVSLQTSTSTSGFPRVCVFVDAFNSWKKLVRQGAFIYLCFVKLSMLAF